MFVSGVVINFHAWSEANVVIKHLASYIMSIKGLAPNNGFSKMR